MKVKVQRNDLFMEVSCIFCGETFPPDIIVATAYSNDHSKTYGEVCPRCLYEGETHILSAIQEQISILQERAQRLLDTAADLSNEIATPLDLPTWMQWRKAHLKTFLGQIGMLDNQTVLAFRDAVKAWPTDKLDNYLAQTVPPNQKDNPLHQAKYAVAWHEQESRQNK